MKTLSLLHGGKTRRPWKGNYCYRLLLFVQVVSARFSSPYYLFSTTTTSTPGSIKQVNKQTFTSPTVVTRIFPYQANPNPVQYSVVNHTSHQQHQKTHPCEISIPTTRSQDNHIKGPNPIDSHPCTSTPPCRIPTEKSSTSRKKNDKKRKKKTSNMILSLPHTPKKTSPMAQDSSNFPARPQHY